MQFASTDARLATAIASNELNCLSLVRYLSLLTPPGLVVRLATDTEVSASPGHAYAFQAPLREGLPEGFFTTRTP